MWNQSVRQGSRELPCQQDPWRQLEPQEQPWAVLRQRPPTLGSCAPTWPEPAPQGANSLRCFHTGECCSPGLQRSSKNNSVAVSYHSCPKGCRLSCGPLWRKWRKGSVCPQTPGRMERASRQKGHIAAQGIVSPVALSCPGKVS